MKPETEIGLGLGLGTNNGTGFDLYWRWQRLIFGSLRLASLRDLFSINLCDGCESEHRLMLSTEMRRTREQRLTFFYFCVGLAKPISDFQLLYKMMLSDLCFLHIFSYSFVTYRRERIGYPQTH